MDVAGHASYASRVLLNFSQCVGMLISVERTQKEFADSDQGFLITMLSQLHTKLVSMFEKYVEEQLKFIEEARHKTKRKGVLPFMRIFPVSRYLHHSTIRF
jgi:hypothetical protein